MGKTLDIDVEEETWKGDTRLKARIVASEVTKKRIESIDSMLKSGDEPEQPEDEDIPF
jgi:hypothetical protein